MKIGSLAAAVKIGIGVMIVLAQGAAAYAAEIKVLHTPAFRAVINDLGPQFERSTGHKLVIKVEVSAVLKRQIEAGETFDVAILTRMHIDDLTKQGKIASGTRAHIARSGIGVGARAGASKPDISSVDAFKRMLLNAKSVTYSAEGASGIHFNSLLDRLGIAAEMKPKLKPVATGVTAERVARGEAEIVVAPIPSIVAVPGVELVGPLPSELQSYIDFTAGVASGAKEAEAAKALIKFLAAPAAAPVLKAKGMESASQ